MKRTNSLGPLALAVACFLQPGLGSYWTATRLYVYEPTPYTYPYGCDKISTAVQQCTTTILTDRRFAVKHTSIPTGVTPLSISTETYPYWDIEIVSVFFPAGAVPQSELDNYFKPTITTAIANTAPAWVVDLTFTAPVSCPTPFEYTTTSRLPNQVPSELSVILFPKATVEEQFKTYTRTVVTSSEGRPPATSTETLTAISTHLHLKPSDVAPTLRPHTTDSEYDWFNDYYIQKCDTPEAAEERWEAELERWRLQELSKCPPNYHRWSGRCRPIALWAVIVIAVVSFVFFLGLIENFFWFRRLMLGKWCFRFGTVSWFCLVLFVACFTTHEQSRSPDDQERLKEQWKALSFGMKLKLWLKWGFRHKYPVKWLGARKPVGEESIEMGRRTGGTRVSGSTVNPGPGVQDGENDMPLPAYPGPPSSRVSDTHSMSSGTTVAHTGPVLGNPNAVLALTTGSGTVVIGPTMSSAQPQTATQRAEADRGAYDGFRAL